MLSIDSLHVLETIQLSIVCHEINQHIVAGYYWCLLGKDQGRRRCLQSHPSLTAGSVDDENVLRSCGIRCRAMKS